MPLSLPKQFEVPAAPNPAPFPIPLDERYLSTEHVARILNTRIEVIRKSRSCGLLFGRDAPLHKKMGTKKVYYDAQTIIDWVDEVEPQRVVGAQK